MHTPALCSKKPLRFLLMEATPVVIRVTFPGSTLPPRDCWNFNELLECLTALKTHPHVDGRLDVTYAASKKPVARGENFEHERTFFVHTHTSNIHLTKALIGITTPSDGTLTGVQFKSGTGLKLHVAEHEAKVFSN